MVVKVKQPIRVLPPPKAAAKSEAVLPRKPAPKAAAPGPKKKPVPEPVETAAPETNGQSVTIQEPMELVDIPLSDIQLTPDPHRSESEEAEKHSIFDLARSFQDLGIMHPIVVNAIDGGGYEIVAGRKRVKAAALLNWETIPAVIKNYDDVKTKMAVITENIIRTGYVKAEYDRAIAEWGLLYETLHPETKQHVSAGKASAVKAAEKVAEKSGKKVAAKAPTKTFTRTVAESTGLAPRTVERARKRGTTFTDDDYAVFKVKGITVHNQDAIAAVTDPKKRQAIIKQIHDGVPFRKAWDFIMLPPGSVSSVEAADDAGKPQSDEEWLAQCPIRGKVVTKLFDAQALFYRRLVDLKTKLERGFNQARKEFKGLTGGSKGYPASVNRFIKVKHPKEWIVCGTCSGTGAKDKTPCSSCDGGGFSIG